MDHTRHSLLDDVPGLRDALTQACIPHGITVEDLVQFSLGREVWTRYPDGALVAARAALSQEAMRGIAKVGPRWPEPAPRPMGDKPPRAPEPDADGSSGEAPSTSSGR